MLRNKKVSFFPLFIMGIIAAEKTDALIDEMVENRWNLKTPFSTFLAYYTEHSLTLLGVYTTLLYPRKA